MTLVRNRHFLDAGQSYGREGYNQGGSYGPFMQSMIDACITDAASIQTALGGSPTIASGQAFRLLNTAVDGSAVLAANQGSNGYWVENDATTNGPRLTSALSSITGDDLGHSVIVYSHGEQDAPFVADSTDADNVRAGMEHILSELRDTEHPANPAGVPVFVDMLGPRYSNHELGEYMLRDAMLDMIAAGSRLYKGAEKYAVSLDSTTHPSEDFNGYARLGAWTGRKASQWVRTLDTINGPSISTVVKTGTTVVVTLNVPLGQTLVRPDEPDFFGLFDNDENRIEILNYSWDGNALTLTADTEPDKFRYPARHKKTRRAVIENVVRLANPSNPLFDGEPGLPLESAKTVTFP